MKIRHLHGTILVGVELAEPLDPDHAHGDPGRGREVDAERALRAASAGDDDDRSRGAAEDDGVQVDADMRSLLECSSCDPEPAPLVLRRRQPGRCVAVARGVVEPGGEARRAPSFGLAPRASSQERITRTPRDACARRC